MDKLLVVLDADWTIRKPASGGRFTQTPTDQVKINEWIFDKHPGASFVALSNQAGVQDSRVPKDLDFAIEEGMYTMKLFPQIELYMFCPGYSGKVLFCVEERFQYIKESEIGGYRKPGCLAITEVMKEYGVSPEETIMYGDMTSDQEAAEAAEIEFVMV